MENHQFHTSWWEKRPACHLKAKRVRYSYSLPPWKLRPSHITQLWLIIAAIDGSRAKDTKKQEQWETRCVQSRSSNAHVSGRCGLQREWAAAARFPTSHSPEWPAVPQCTCSVALRRLWQGKPRHPLFQLTFWLWFSGPHSDSENYSASFKSSILLLNLDKLNFNCLTLPSLL